MSSPMIFPLRGVAIGATVFFAASTLAQAEPPVAAAKLKYAPEQTHISLGLPNVQEVLNRVIALEARVSPDDREVKEAVDELVADLAAEVGATGAEDLNAVFAAKGIDATKGAAVFVDLSEMLNDALEQIKAHNAEQEKAAAETDAADGAETADTAGDEVGDDGGDAGDDAEGDDAEDEEEFELDFDDLEEPHWAVAFSISDRAAAEAGLEELISELPEELGDEAVEEAVGDVKVQVYNDYAYFFDGDTTVVLGNKDMVTAAAQRVAAPAEVRYGTEALPGVDEQEIVALVYGAKFLPQLKEALPLLVEDEATRPFVEMQAASLDAMFGPNDPNDPLVAGIALTDDQLSVDIRIDTEKHPGVLQFGGAAAPLRLAQLLPEETLALLSLRLNEETKKQLTENVLPAIGSAMGEENDPQRMAIANQVFDMIGDEVTVGIAGAKDDFPAIYIMIGLADPEPTKGLLSMFIPTQPGEKHGEVDISTVAAPIPVPVSIAYPGDMLLLSNNVEGMKKVIDLVGDEATTNLFAELNMDAKTPRYNSLVLNTKLFTDVLMPLAALTGGLPGEVEPIVNQLSPVIKEIRYFQEIQAPWSVTKLVVSLHPEGEAKGEDAGEDAGEEEKSEQPELETAPAE